MVGEKFGIRFTEVADPEEMVQNLYAIKLTLAN